jgi:hypothetical protein
MCAEVAVLTWPIAIINGAFPLAIAASKIGVRAGANQAGAASRCVISVHVADANRDQQFTPFAMGHYYVGLEYRGSGSILGGRRIRELSCCIGNPHTKKKQRLLRKKCMLTNK